MIGGSLADTFAGGDGDNLLVGSGADDVFIGSADPEEFSGLAGADLFRPGVGADIITTGTGTDVVEGSLGDLDGDRITDFGLGDAIRVQGAHLPAPAVGLSEGSAISALDSDGDGITDSRFTLDGSFEAQLFALSAEGGDTVIRLAAQNEIMLSPGDDRFESAQTTPLSVFGDLGDDLIQTASGNDILSGGAGNDDLRGGAGSDVLIGGAGFDRMTGGEGADLFALDASAFGSTPVTDVITDFTPGEDGLELTGFGLTDISQLALQEIGPDLQIDLGAGRLLILRGLGAGDLLPGDVIFGTVARDYGIVSLSPLHRLTERDDIFETSDAADNVIHAGGGDDLLAGGAGDDYFDGGDGKDTVSYEGAGGRLPCS